MTDRQCHTCTKQDEYGCFAVRIRHPEKGHQDTPANWHKPALQPTLINGEAVFACPRQTMREDPRSWTRVLMFYSMFKNGFLPDAGNITDQSNSLLETLRVIDDENMSCDRQLADKAAAKQARSKPKGKGHKV